MKLFYAISLVLIFIVSSFVSMVKKSSEELNHNVRKQCQNVSLLFFLLGALELMFYEYLELGVSMNKIKVTDGFFNFIHIYSNVLDICLLICLFMFILGTFFHFILTTSLPNSMQVKALGSSFGFLIFLLFFI